MAALLTSACGRKRTSASTSRKTPQGATSQSSKSPVARSESVKPGTTQVGLASWYGEPYHGRRAANGEVYDMNKLTAAHRTLPFDTLVSVLNLDNQREVRVRINDRGPFVGDRIIDLSRAAAQEISMLGPGIAKVRVEVLSVKPVVQPAKFPAKKTSPPAPTSEERPAEEDSDPAMQNGAGYAVQIGAFSDAEAAEKLQRRMASRYGNAYIEKVRSDKGMLYRVRVGPKPTMAEAVQLAASLERENFPSLVVRVDLPIRN